MAASVCSWGLGDQGLLLVEGEWLQINPHIELWLDIAILEGAFKRTQGIRGRDLEEGQVQMLQRAAELYCGDLFVYYEIYASRSIPASRGMFSMTVPARHYFSDDLILDIGCVRAARILDQLMAAGVVSPQIIRSPEELFGDN